MKAWLSLVSMGVLASFVVTSCVITSDDDPDDENGGEAGETSTGGRSTGERASGGTTTGGTSTGGKASGGNAPTGGTPATGGSGTGGREPTSCEVGSKPADTCEFEDGGDCEACLAENCCEEVKGCYGSEPDDVCGWPVGDGEFECNLLCLATVYAEGDYPGDDELGKCLDECDTCIDEKDPNRMLPNGATAPLVGCMNNGECGEICYEQALGLN